ncbi:MAG TPA: hypothetical protein VHZ24_19090, partial [Pirellulales bacterium]|nr:hypothetical protein [Pirellulales bacterium]
MPDCRHRRRLGTLLLVLAGVLLSARGARAQGTIIVGSSSDFYNAIQTIDSNPSNNYTLSLTGDITMSQQVSPISTSGTITVAGNGFTLNGGGAYRPFFIEAGNVALQNLTITNAEAHGGNGGVAVGGGGGGLGAGGAVLVDSNGHVTLSNVAFSSDSAVGGNGGGTVAGITSGGGGGGLFGNGGDSSHAGGGGGGGLTASGSSATSNNLGAAGAGGTPGGSGYGIPGSSGTYGNGGGGGGIAAAGGAGGDFGGGGGGGYVGGAGGAGGFGGGGGGSGSLSSGGTAGFGGGNGGGISQAGNGGSAFGGALFVRAGGTITFDDSTTFTNNTVTGGTGGGTGASNGPADGNDLFLMRGTTTTFNIGVGQTFTFAPSIGNEDGTSSTLSGVAIDKTGLGTLVLNGSSGLSGSTVVDSGTLVVNDTLAGTMTVNSGGTLMGIGTVGGDTTINAGGTVYPGTVGAPLTISGNFTQNSGSSYTAEVSATGSDKIVVNGSATIHTGSTFNIVLDPGTYTTGTHYVVMTASGGITGSYSTTILPSPGTNQYFSL